MQPIGLFTRSALAALAWGATALCAASAPASAVQTAPVQARVAPAANQLLPAQSEVRFTAKQMGVPMQGVFTQLTGTVQWNAAKPEASQFA